MSAYRTAWTAPTNAHQQQVVEWPTEAEADAHAIRLTHGGVREVVVCAVDEGQDASVSLSGPPRSDAEAESIRECHRDADDAGEPQMGGER